MAADDPLNLEPLVSVEFEVFGKVQGEATQQRVLQIHRETIRVLEFK